MRFIRKSRPKHIIHEYTDEFKYEDDDIMKGRGTYQSAFYYYCSVLCSLSPPFKCLVFCFIIRRRGIIALIIPSLIHYGLFLLPIFIKEIYLGQFTSRGAIFSMGYCDFFKGLGYSSIILSSVLIANKMMYCNYYLYHLFHTIFYNVPWKVCSYKNCMTSANCLDLKNYTNKTFSSDIYFHKSINSDDIFQFGLKSEVISFTLIWIVLFTGLVTKLRGMSYIFAAAVVMKFSFIMAVIIGLFFTLQVPGTIVTFLAFDIKNFFNVSEIPSFVAYLMISSETGSFYLITLSSFNDFKYNFKFDPYRLIIAEILMMLFSSYALFVVDIYIEKICGISISSVDHFDDIERYLMLGFDKHQIFLALTLLSYLSLHFGSLLVELFNITISIGDLYPNVYLSYRKFVFLSLIVCSFGYIMTFCITFLNVPLLNRLRTLNRFELVIHIILLLSTFSLYCVYPWSNVRLDVKMMFKSFHLSMLLNVIYCIMPVSIIMTTWIVINKNYGFKYTLRNIGFLAASVIIVYSPFLLISFKTVYHCLRNHSIYRLKTEIFKQPKLWGPYYRRHWLLDIRYQRKIATYRFDQKFIAQIPKTETLKDLLLIILSQKQNDQ